MTSGGARSARRVAVIDDSRVVVDLVRKVLTDGGHDSRGFSEAFGVDAALVEFAPDVILLDVGMTGVGEGGVRERVETFRRLTGARVLLHSGRDEDELEILVKRAGADGALTKSGDFDAILRAVAAD